MRKDEEEQVRDIQDSTDDLLRKDIKGNHYNQYRPMYLLHSVISLSQAFVPNVLNCQ